jgi:NAD(P)-dependent dehydrogenase (short-subunit alcohol dehydrogenase family)
MAHLATDLRYEDSDFEHGASYDRFVAYSQSKTAVTLFTKALKKHATEVRNLTAVAAHPGLVHSNIFSDLSKQDFIDTGMYNKDGLPEDNEWATWKSQEEGAASYVPHGGTRPTDACCSIAYAAFEPSLAGKSLAAQ